MVKSAKANNRVLVVMDSSRLIRLNGPFADFRRFLDAKMYAYCPPSALCAGNGRCQS